MLTQLRAAARRLGLSAERRSGPPDLLADSIRATLGAIGGYLPGFFIPVAIAIVLGADAATDTFFLALSVSALIANTAGAASQHVAIPFLIAARRDGADTGRFVGEMATTLVILAAVPTLLANTTVAAVARDWSGWDAGQVALLRSFLWWLVPYVGCSVLAGVYSAALAAEHRYVRAALSPAVRSVIVLAAVLSAPSVGIHALVWGYAIGEGARMLLLARAARMGRPAILFAWPARGTLSQFQRSVGAQVLGAGLLASIPVVDRAMASSLGAGNVSLLEYADRFWQLPVSFAMSGFVITSLSHWSERFHRDGSLAALSRDITRASAGLFALFLPLTVVVLVFGRPLVGLVLAGSDLSGAELDRLTATLQAFVLVVPIYVAGLVYTRAFLVLRRADWLFGINVVQVLVKVVLNVLLLPVLGLVGIALATSATYAVSTVLLVGLFHLRLSRRPAA